MSELSPPPDTPPLVAGAPDPATSIPIAPVTAIGPAGAVSPFLGGAPVAAPPSHLPPEMAAFLELIGRALMPDADEPTRALARELWARCAHAIVAAAAPTAPHAPAMPAPTGPLALATMPAAPIGLPVAMPASPPLVPASPIAVAAQTLRQMSPDQLLELALARLRGALPAGAAVSAPKGIQFQLVPVTPPLTAR